MRSTHPFDTLTVRISRRTVIAGFAGGLVAQAVHDRLESLAKKNRGKGKGKGKPGKKQHHKRDRGQGDITTQIVGGSTVPSGKYSFQVAISDKRYGKKGFKEQFCGGSLIDAWHVLTAAHCVAGRATTRPRNLRVIIGRSSLNSKQGETRQVAKITVHPDYNGKTITNDAAVIQLEAPVDLQAYPAIKPAGSADKGLEEAGTLLTVTGWGSMRKQVAGKKKHKAPKYSHGLRAVQVPVVADDECKQNYSGKHGGKINAAVMLCAGKPGVDSCNGDSGGPLFAETDEGMVQVGIVSWGVGCGGPGRPGVYTRISALSDFIQSAIKDAP